VRFVPFSFFQAPSATASERFEPVAAGTSGFEFFLVA
jgi:hypothetical protein